MQVVYYRDRSHSCKDVEKLALHGRERTGWYIFSEIRNAILGRYLLPGTSATDNYIVHLYAFRTREFVDPCQLPSYLSQSKTEPILYTVSVLPSANIYRDLSVVNPSFDIVQDIRDHLPPDLYALVTSYLYVPQLCQVKDKDAQLSLQIEDLFHCRLQKDDEIIVVHDDNLEYSSVLGAGICCQPTTLYIFNRNNHNYRDWILNYTKAVLFDYETPFLGQFAILNKYPRLQIRMVWQNGRAGCIEYTPEPKNPQELMLIRQKWIVFQTRKLIPDSCAFRYSFYCFPAKGFRSNNASLMTT